MKNVLDKIHSVVQDYPDTSTAYHMVTKAIANGAIDPSMLSSLRQSEQTMTGLTHSINEQTVRTHHPPHEVGLRLDVYDKVAAVAGLAENPSYVMKSAKIRGPSTTQYSITSHRQPSLEQSIKDHLDDNAVEADPVFTATTQAALNEAYHAVNDEPSRFQQAYDTMRSTPLFTYPSTSISPCTMNPAFKEHNVTQDDVDLVNDVGMSTDDAGHYNRRTANNRQDPNE